MACAGIDIAQFEVTQPQDARSGPVHFPQIFL